MCPSGGTMGRREFVALLGSVAVVCPFVGRAHQSVVPTIGFLNSASSDLQAARLRAFRSGLSETGYIEGRNVAIEYRWADNQFDRLPALAQELVRHKVAVIATGYNLAAAKAAKEDCICQRRGPREDRAGQQSQPPRRQHHWCEYSN